MILINSLKQTLTYNNIIYPISTAKNGLGEEGNSFKTPRGKFRICEKIGQNSPIYTIFKARKSIDIWDKKYTCDDLILSRILWLDGVEEHNKNTRNRFIYIHGTSHEKDIGTPTSQGCIRMKNKDVIELFDKINIGDLVIIK